MTEATTSPRSKPKNYEKTINKLITHLREQELSLEDEKPVATKAMTSYIQAVIPEFQNCNQLSLAFLLSQAKIIELHSKQSSTKVGESIGHKRHRVEDHNQIGFYMLLKGRCEIVFEVVKMRRLDHFDSSQEGDAMMRQIDLYQGEEREAEYEGVTMQDDQSMSNPSYEAVSKPTVTLAQQVKPQPSVKEDFKDDLYPTAVGFAEEEESASEAEAESGEVPQQQAVKHYETAYAKVQLMQHESVSDLTIEEQRVKNFDSYFQRHYEQLLQQGAIKAMPESLAWPVMEYKDRIYSIETSESHSVLLFVPQMPFKQFYDSQTKEQRALEKLLYECLPSLQTYTASYMNRLLPCFQELCFYQNQIVFKANKDPEHVYLIAEGAVKLVAYDNPFGNQQINTKEALENPHEKKPQVSIASLGTQGTLSKSITVNQLGFIQGNTWIGEENALLDLPVIYDVIASSPTVRIYRILKDDFKTKVPIDVLVKVEDLLWPRINYMRDRLLDIHETRNEIIKMDKVSSSLPTTFQHMSQMYPNSTKSLQKKFRIQTLEKSGGNPALLLFSDNRGKDTQRLRRAGQNAEKEGFQYKSLREKLNSASKRRKQIQFGTVEQGQSTIDLIKNQPKKTLAQQRETQRSPLKNYDENLKIAQESTALFHTLPTEVNPSALPDIALGSVKQHSRKQSLVFASSSLLVNAPDLQMIRTPLAKKSALGDVSVGRELTLESPFGINGAMSPIAQAQLHDLNYAGRSLQIQNQSFQRDRQNVLPDLHGQTDSPINDDDRLIQIEPRANSASRNQNLLNSVKQAELSKKGNSLKGRNRSIHLSSNLWDRQHQRQLSKSTLKELPGVKISPRSQLPAVGQPIKPQTRRFMEKIQQMVPKGQVNHADTISFLERIIQNQDGIKTLHNAFTRKKNSLYA